MASSTSWKLRALLKKNFLILKRNICSTIFEIFFPILLILICLALKQVFKIKTVLFDDEEGNEDDYIKSKSAFYDQRTSFKLYDIEDESTFGLSILPVLKICSEELEILKTK